MAEHGYGSRPKDKCRFPAKGDPGINPCGQTHGDGDRRQGGAKRLKNAGMSGADGGAPRSGKP